MLLQTPLILLVYRNFASNAMLLAMLSKATFEEEIFLFSPCLSEIKLQFNLIFGLRIDQQKIIQYCRKKKK